MGLNGLCSRVQIKSQILSNFGDRQVVHVSIRDDGKYDVMLIMFVVHVPASDEVRIKFEQDMDAESFHLPDFDSVYVTAFASLETYPELAFLFLMKLNISGCSTAMTSKSQRKLPSLN